MDKIILGLLIINKLTIYEIRTTIKQSLQAMCSDSLGAIQAALKKLLTNEMIIFVEITENGVNKKKYEITDKGREYFQEWVNTPIRAGKTKDIEVSKLLFMGFADQTKRVELIEAYLDELNEEQVYLTTIEQMIKEAKKFRADQENFELTLKTALADEKHIEKFLEITKGHTLTEAFDKADCFAQYSLDLGKVMLATEIKWYQDLLKQLKKEQRELKKSRTKS